MNKLLTEIEKITAAIQSYAEAAKKDAFEICTEILDFVESKKAEAVGQAVDAQEETPPQSQQIKDPGHTHDLPGSQTETSQDSAGSADAAGAASTAETSSASTGEAETKTEGASTADAGTALTETSTDAGAAASTETQAQTETSGTTGTGSAS